MISDSLKPSSEVDEVVEKLFAEDMLEGEKQVAENDDVARGNALLNEVCVVKEVVVQNPVKWIVNCIQVFKFVVF